MRITLGRCVGVPPLTRHRGHSQYLMPFAMDSGFCHDNGADIGECGGLAEITSCDFYFAKMKETPPPL
jgi:hypothetical protein